MATLVYYDLETDSTRTDAQIIQLAAAATIDNVVDKTFEAKLQFDVSKADPKALEINGYTEERWANAEPPAVVAKKFAAFLSKYKTMPMTSKAGKPYKVARLAGYNSQAFDQKLLVDLFRQLDIFLPAYYISYDVMQLVVWFSLMNPGKTIESFKLGSVCEYFGVELNNAHDALADTLATAQLVPIIGELMLDMFSGASDK